LTLHKKVKLKPNIHGIISRQERNLFYEFAFENFNNMCHFCFNLRDEDNLEEIDHEDSDLVQEISFLNSGKVSCLLFQIIKNSSNFQFLKGSR
jgi:hypothetical protein